MRSALTPQDKETIRNALPPETKATITIIPAEKPNEAHARMVRFCDRLKTVAPHVRIKKDSDTAFQAPALIVGHHGNIAYRSIPEGKIVQRFLDALTQENAAAPRFKNNIAQLLDRITLPVDLKVYIAVQCPHCPKTLEHLQDLASASAKVRLTVVDAAMFPEDAQADTIRAVPTVLLDDQFRWSGRIELEEMLTVSIERDPAQLSPASLRQLIEEGAAEMVAQMMIDSHKVFPALIELLANERWSVRLGAMVTVEYLAEAGTGLDAELVAPLWKRLAQASQQAQGDMVHVLGQIPTTEARECLQRVADGSYAQPVVTAAIEALEEME